MLSHLGLEAFRGNFREGMLSDMTLPLLTDDALRDARIPPGPRLLIMDHVRAHKKFYQEDLRKREEAAAAAQAAALAASPPGADSDQ